MELDTKTLLEALPLPTLLLDENRSVVAFNETARFSLGVDLIGADLSSSFRSPALIDAVDQVLGHGGTVVCEMEHRPKPSRTYQVTVSKVTLERSRHVFLVFMDLTSMHHMEDVRSTFVANVSHELRSPLTAVMGAVEALEGPAGDSSEERLRMLSLIGQEALRMKNLIDDLLSLSRVEAKEYIRPNQLVNVGTLLDIARDRMHNRASQNDSTIVISIAEDLPKIHGVEEEILEVFDNLMSNAIKYGAPGSEMGVMATETAKGICVSVHNTGAPIPSEHLPRLTERFYRVEKSRSRKLEGTGLGLSIVKHIVNHHGGTLEIESTEQKGTTFSVFFPIAE
ncbi:MAG: ATP-binding protein [Rhodospirillaceae bacterium]